MNNIFCPSEVTGNNGTFFSDGPVSVVNNGTIPLTNNSFVNGTSISHTPGSDSIFLSPKKTYFVYYKCTTPTGTLSCRLLLNGVIMNASTTTVIPNTAQQSMITASIIINTPASPVPSTLQLQNISGATKTFNQLAITVIRID